MSDHFLILTRREGTGGVQQPAAGVQHGNGVGNNVFLDFSEKFRTGFVPGLGNIGVFAEHTFPGTRSIYQNFIKKFREISGETSGCFVGDHGVADAEKLQVSQQGLCTGITDIISHEKAFSLQFGAQGRGFSPRCGA